MQMKNVGVRFVFAAALVIGLVITTFGVNDWSISDGVVYRQIADQIHAGRGISNPDVDWGFLGKPGAPLTVWAPLHPVILAAFLTVEPAYPFLLRLHNVLCYAGAVTLTWIILSRITARRELIVVGTVCAAFNPALLEITPFAIPEPLFVVMVLLALVWLDDTVKAFSWKRLLLLAALCGAAVMQRYPGITLVVSVGICLAFALKLQWRARLKVLLVYGVVSLLPLALWMVRNTALTGEPLGPRFPPVRPYVIAHIYDATLTIASWGAVVVIICAGSLLGAVLWRVMSSSSRSSS